MQNYIPAAPDAAIIATAPEWGCALRLPVIAWQPWVKRDNKHCLHPITPLGIAQEFRYALAYRGGYCDESGVTYPDAEAWLMAVTPKGLPLLRLRNHLTQPVAESVAQPTDASTGEVHDGD